MEKISAQLDMLGADLDWSKLFYTMDEVAFNLSRSRLTSWQFRSFPRSLSPLFAIFTNPVLFFALKDP